jgi:hypothetical protein
LEWGSKNWKARAASPSCLLLDATLQEQEDIKGLAPGLLGWVENHPVYQRKSQSTPIVPVLVGQDDPFLS